MPKAEEPFRQNEQLLRRAVASLSLSALSYSRKEDRQWFGKFFGQYFKAMEDMARSEETHIRGGIAVHVVMRRMLHPEDWTDLVVALASGDAKFGRRRAGVKFSISELVLERGGASRLAHSKPKRFLPGDIFVPVVCAARLACMNNIAMCGVIKLGLLGGAKRGGRRHISLRDLSRFASTYFISPEASQYYGVDGRVFSRCMQEAGRVPVGAISRFTIWLRQDAETVLSAKGWKMKFPAPLDPLLSIAA